jgi:hypothetical protein
MGQLPPPWLTDISVLSICNFMLGHILAFPESFFSFTLVENFEPSVVQLIYCVMYSPWICKPLYARFIDKGTLPVESYMQRILPLSALIWFVILFADNLKVTLCLFVFDAFVISFADVALDTLMVKRSKLVADEREVQSHVLIARSLGMMVGVYLGGLVMTAFGPVAVFACCIIEAMVFCAFAFLLSDVQTPAATGAPLPALRDIMTPTMKSALWFTFLVHMVPDLSGLYDYVLIDDLHFTPVIIGSLDMLGYVALAAGTFAYNAAFKGRSNMRIVQVALAVISIETIMPIALVLGWNVRAGMASITLASMDGFFRSISQQLLSMPIRGAILPFCTEGNEGTVYATFTALANVSTIGAMILGSIMSEAAGLTRDDLRPLWILFVVRGILYAVMIPVARLLPDSIPGVTDAKTATASGPASLKLLHNLDTPLQRIAEGDEGEPETMDAA